MDFGESPEEQAFRSQVRAWFTDNTPQEWSQSGKQVPEGTDPHEFARDWQRRLHAGGWSGLGWPAAFGGREASLTEQVIFIEEEARAGAPQPLDLIGLNMVGPTIIDHGTDEQRRRFLPAILAGDEVWCQGFSEPGAGSDVVALRTRATPDGDGWVINGQKIWTTNAHVAAWCMLLARSNPDAPRHAGITCFLVDMGSSGVEVRPIRQMDGGSVINEIFFDEVHVPADAVLGQVDAGWRVATTTLMHERRNAALAFFPELDRQLGDLAQLAHALRVDDCLGMEEVEVARRLGSFHAEVQVLRLSAYRVLAQLARTGVAGPEGSVLKLHWADLNQRMTAFSWDLLGGMGQAPVGHAFADQAESWQRRLLRARANSIEGGTTEILRSVVAERVLGLPRSR